MLEGLYRISERTGKPYYGAAALVGNIFAKQQREEYDRAAELEEYRRILRQYGYVSDEEE